MVMAVGVAQSATVLYSDDFNDTLGTLGGQNPVYRDATVSGNQYFSQNQDPVETAGVGLGGTGGLQLSTSGSGYLPLYADADVVSAGYTELTLSMDVDMGSFTTDGRADRGLWLGFMGTTPNSDGFTGLRGVGLNPDGTIWIGRKWSLPVTWEMGTVDVGGGGYHNLTRLGDGEAPEVQHHVIAGGVIDILPVDILHPRFPGMVNVLDVCFSRSLIHSMSLHESSNPNLQWSDETYLQDAR